MPLSQQQLDEIKANAYLGYIDKLWIKDNFGVSVRTADRIIKGLQLTHSKQQTIQILKGYLAGKTAKHLAQKYQMTENNVRGLLRFRGIKRESPNRYHANFHYFSSINTEAKAYLLGFLYADGCLTKKDTLTITVAKKDKDIIEKFKQEMEAEHPIREHIASTHVGDFPVVTIDITSPILAEDLKKVGVVPSKTLKITFPKQLERSLFKAFIRGYIDGDGTFCLCKNNQYALDIEGTESLLESIRLIFQNELAVPASAKLYSAHKSGIKRLQLRGKNQVMTVLNWLYSDAQIHLDRKYQKFLDIRNQSNN